MFLNSRADSSNSTLSIWSSKAAESTKLVLFSKMFDYPRWGLLGINVVSAVSITSAIPNILNAERQIPVVLICVDFIIVQNS